MSDTPSTNSSLLVFNKSGIAANTAGLAPSYQNPDPMFVSRTFLNTIYVWATTWDTAEVQIFVAPQRKGSPFPTVWFPLGSPLTANGLFSFQHRWSQIKAEVTNASPLTVELYCKLFDGGFGTF